MVDDDDYDAAEDEEYQYEEEEEEYQYEEEEYDDEEDNVNEDVAINCNDKVERDTSLSEQRNADCKGADNRFDTEMPRGRSSSITSSGDKRSSGIGATKLSLGVVPSDSYNIIGVKDVEVVMAALIDDVSSLLDIPADMAQSLLQNSKWDKERLIDAFFFDSEKILKQAGLTEYKPVPTSHADASAFAAAMPAFQCRICYDEVMTTADSNSGQNSNTVNGISTGGAVTGEGNGEKKKQKKSNQSMATVEAEAAVGGFSLGCGHKFCSTCFSAYLTTQVNDGPPCIIARCPEFKCTQVVTPAVFHLFLDPHHRETYDRYFIRNFIETSKSMKYCPAPGCEKVAVGSGVTTVKCTCGHPFCFRCGEESHDPCSCPQLAEWGRKCMNESETANWILANTRTCPACNARIEKNQGCNHMTCRNCKHDFCWICMGPWAEHGQTTGGFYKCNRFVPTNTKSSANAVEKAKRELDRYLHYYQRYHGHDHALKFASSQRELAEARMVEQQEQQKTSWIDVQFLKQAAEQVIDCRRVLKYTYVLGFYLDDSTGEKQLFEHHQEMLEKNTERLQEYTEKPLEEIDRTQVVNLTRVTEKFMASLLASMTGGVVMIDSSDTVTAMAVAVDEGVAAAAGATTTTTTTTTTTNVTGSSSSSSSSSSSGRAVSTRNSNRK
eukprot:CAMPEP_0174990518 /NCGR_PEP_ID=MMETSP0004_2-20121128/21372_1 /TAXON_ID=420556 /ORGANISM="Ochromonas sp., Strain CCMP1393" /LENGTH=664 /DNA_ID=CAMNT_0016244147 /DNA_START=79 /DNA_END=2073 /DNA_ORIENTATION=+